MRLLEEHPEKVGYLLKERVFDVAVLVDALRRIDDGETVVDPTIVSRLVGRRRREDPLEELTEREREVLSLVAEGLSNRAIAGPPVRHRAHRRGPHQADLPQARPAESREHIAACSPCSPSFARPSQVSGSTSTRWPSPQIMKDGPGLQSPSSSRRHGISTR